MYVILPTFCLEFLSLFGSVASTLSGNIPTSRHLSYLHFLQFVRLCGSILHELFAKIHLKYQGRACVLCMRIIKGARIELTLLILQGHLDLAVSSTNLYCLTWFVWAVLSWRRPCSCSRKWLRSGGGPPQGCRTRRKPLGAPLLNQLQEFALEQTSKHI